MVEYLKYPDIAFDYINSKYNIISRIFYALDWRKSRTALVELVPWLNSQVEGARTEGYLDSMVGLIMKNVKPDDYDTIVIKVLRQVISILKYETDDKKWKVPEVWEDVYNVYQTRKADCESGALLVYVLCRLCGVPVNRLFLAAGSVTGGGHAWIAYRPSFLPNHFVFLDWCYWPDENTVFNRKVYYVHNNKVYYANKPDKNYQTIWWVINEEQGYINIST